jgi:hypothetical protein
VHGGVLALSGIVPDKGAALMALMLEGLIVERAGAAGGGTGGAVAVI